MKIIKNSKEITTLELGDKVVFGTLEYTVALIHGYYLRLKPKNIGETNNKIFRLLSISERNFVENLGIDILFTGGSFPEVKSLEALTAIVSALFKEYEKQNEFPKTWEEFCKRNPVKKGECVIDLFSNIHETEESIRNAGEDRNYCISKQEAEAFLALMQLRQLRKAYVKDWEPDYEQQCHRIVSSKYGIKITQLYIINNNLSFPTYELAIQFLNNFKDLLEIAKPLL